MSIGILGGGAFGTALAIALDQTQDVTLWARDTTALSDRRESPRLPGARLPETVTVTAEFAEVTSSDTLLLAVPMQQLAGVLAQIDDPLEGKSIVACCKGIDLETGFGPAHIVALAKPLAVPAILTGPSFAADIARGLPTALTLACQDEERGKALQQSLSTPTLRLYRSTDITGAEIGGALKNVIAIACGVTIGAGLGDSARAALMTRGFAEMTRFAVANGARAETLSGLSGFGDLALTCTSDLSRNYRFGVALGRGDAFDSSTTVEGAATAQALQRVAQDQNIALPIASAVAQLVEGRLTVQDVIKDLLARPLKEEKPC
ncbi:NAD(P)-dependent glycerol-3-phosphate dehydrogenase [Primorskyibacter aestuariivivens]|uniref:NAD(P)H-dependent glycerol-3-phosphate dehydrogenase n=1 Tax=Primorskyibacter aestuariivivens TaxID=1888912 RepID=UPI0023001509|nr:NAD(P)H-dependent glycerol-3-phosphate dehydrogenase [Primorskyibacter aestuariivivens]MDA7427595.1 NAD(P)-dependent glycerol-3-phosphate dehydrogenase [Primorskyibacter aestuariivivens]